MKIFPGLGLFSAIQFFLMQHNSFSHNCKFSIQNSNIPSGVIPAQKETVSETLITEDSIGNLVPQETKRDIGQTKPHTDYFKANRKRSQKKSRLKNYCKKKNNQS
ncbi:hypothetical protein wTpre_672 [Wolbachia endosymbiont of Trichogramma pretiosum]|nr:hypothetical protein wTpre_672 [Wolbachia endosymbiont of Trichogramma pretiosum]